METDRLRAPEFAATNTASPCFKWSSTLLQLLIPDFYYLPASVLPESNYGYVNWLR